MRDRSLERERRGIHREGGGRERERVTERKGRRIWTGDAQESNLKMWRKNSSIDFQARQRQPLQCV